MPDPRDPYLPSDPAPLGITTLPTRVTIEKPGEEEIDLPGIEPVWIDDFLGYRPSAAKITYILRANSINHVQSWEEAVDAGVTRANTIEPMDRIGIYVWNYNRQVIPEGEEEPETNPGWEPRFLGFAYSLEMSFDGQNEQAAWLCLSQEIRAFDTPLTKSLWADGSDYAATTATLSDEEPHFNPKNLPNKSDVTPFTPAGYTTPFALFVDRLNENYTAEYWSLQDTVQYVLHSRGDDSIYYAIPDPFEIAARLELRVPIEGEVYDPGNPDTFDVKSWNAPDYPAGGKRWPQVIDDLISDKGLACRWTFADDINPGADALGQTKTRRFELLRIDDQPIETIRLQARGASLAIPDSELLQGQFNRDLTQIANRVIVQGDIELWEISVILAPAFPMHASHASDPTAYDLSKLDPADPEWNAYRLFIADECGEGHFANTSETTLYTPLDLSTILGEDHPIRRRVPLGKLITPAPDGSQLRTRLSISKDYLPTGAMPALWDGTGTWQPVSPGTWELLDDRLGIRINAQNPNNWNIGESDISTHPYRNGIVRAVKSLATPNEFHPVFALRLTCVIRGDARLLGSNASTDDSPLTFHETQTLIDAHDRYKLQKLAPYSEFNDTSEAVSFRDDQELADTEAETIALVKKNAQFDGNIVIPWPTFRFEPGTRISQIEGRSVSLQTNYTAEGATPVYPMVLRRTVHFQGEPRTELTLSDSDTTRASYATGGKRASEAE